MTVHGYLWTYLIYVYQYLTLIYILRISQMDSKIEGCADNQIQLVPTTLKKGNCTFQKTGEIINNNISNKVICGHPQSRETFFK